MKRILLAVCLMAGCASINAPVKLQISPVVANNLAFLYDNLRIEYAFCGYGKIENGTVKLERITLPIITYADSMQVWFQYCPSEDGYLGLGHSHPDDYDCEPSQIDVEAFAKVKDKYAFLVCPEHQLKLLTRSK